MTFCMSYFSFKIDVYFLPSPYETQILHSNNHTFKSIKEDILVVECLNPKDV